jgi:16S rRNA C1402 N4-methylase RsmH
MDPEIEKCIEILDGISNDTIDALLAYLSEKDKFRKQIALSIYGKLDKKRTETAKRLCELTKQKWNLR